MRRNLYCQGLFSLILLAIISGCNPSPSSPDKPLVLKIASEGAYYPFDMKNAQGEAEGFDIDIAKAICATLKAQCTFVLNEWDKLIPDLLAHHYDMVIASMTITKERAQKVAFSNHYYSSKLAFIGGRQWNNNNAETLSLLAGKRVGVQRETTMEKFLIDNAPQANIVSYENQELIWQDLALAKLDFVLADMLVGYTWLRGDAGRNYNFVGNLVDTGERMGIAMRPEDIQLKEQVDAALKEILSNGTYQKINAKYFPFSIY